MKSHRKNKVIAVIANVTKEPINIILNVYIKFSKLFCPLNSARNLPPELPKKFVMKMVTIRQKLSITLISPRISAPKERATRKLKIKGISPINIKETPV